MDSTGPNSDATIQPAGRTGWRRLATIVLLLVSAAACDRPAPSGTPQLIEGQAFPPFMLDYVVQGTATTQPLRGKILILNIWATWCAPCRREMPSLERLSKSLDPKRFAVIGLSVDDDTLLATEFLRQTGITFANVFDRNGKVSERLGLQAYPQTFVVAPDGTLVRHVSGIRDWDSREMRALLEQIDRTRQAGSHLAN